MSNLTEVSSQTLMTCAGKMKTSMQVLSRWCCCMWTVKKSDLWQCDCGINSSWIKEQREELLLAINYRTGRIYCILQYMAWCVLACWCDASDDAACAGACDWVSLYVPCLLRASYACIYLFACLLLLFLQFEERGPTASTTIKKGC